MAVLRKTALLSLLTLLARFQAFQGVPGRYSGPIPGFRGVPGRYSGPIPGFSGCPREAILARFQASRVSQGGYSGPIPGFPGYPRSGPGDVPEVVQKVVQRWSGEQKGDEGGCPARVPAVKDGSRRLTGRLTDTGQPDSPGWRGVPGWCTLLPYPALYTTLLYTCSCVPYPVPCRYVGAVRAVCPACTQAGWSRAPF